MEGLWLVLFWTGPIGIGIFLVCLGGMVYLWTKADAIKKGMREEEKDKDKDKE